MSRLTIETSPMREPPFRNKTGKLVWFCLLRDADENGVAVTSARSIAKEIGVSEKAVRNVLEELEQYGITESASPIFGPHFSPHQVRYLGKHITLKNTTTCEIKAEQKNKSKSAQRSDIRSDIVTTNSSSDALSFVAPEFREAFKEWLDFKKKQFKFEYKTKRSLNAAYNELFKLSGGDPRTAMEIVMQSESNGWKGLYELKNNGTKTITNSDTAASRKDSRDRLRALASGVVSRSADKLLNLYNGSGANPDPRED